MTALTRDATPADVLRAAVDYVDRRGWTQGAMVRMDGAACAMGSVIQVGQKNGLSRVTAVAMDLLAEEVLARTGMSPIAFNDAPGRVWDEVRKEMLAVADAWDRGEFR